MPEWNQQQLKIAYMFTHDHKQVKEIMAEMGVSHDSVYKIKNVLDAGGKAPTSDLAEIAKAPPPTKFGEQSPAKALAAGASHAANNTAAKKAAMAAAKAGGNGKKKPILPPGFEETGATMETQLMKFVAHIQSVPLTVNIYVSYGCAVANGYQGSLGDWLNMIALDFWACRNRNMFAEFGASSIYGATGGLIPVESNGGNGNGNGGVANGIAAG